MQFACRTFRYSFIVSPVFCEPCDVSLFCEFHIFLPLPIDMDVISSCRTNHPKLSNLEQQWCIIPPDSGDCTVFPPPVSSGLIRVAAGGSAGLEGPGEPHSHIRELALAGALASQFSCGLFTSTRWDLLPYWWSQRGIPRGKGQSSETS